MSSEQSVVITTGASRGIGAAVARWLGKMGVRTALVARHQQDLQQVADEVAHLGGEALAIKADVADIEACQKAVEAAIAHFGRLDALVNNAGMLEPIAPVAEADPSVWHRNVMVNLVGPYYLTRFALAELRGRQGRIVNVSTGAALHPIETWSAYCASTLIRQTIEPLLSQLQAAEIIRASQSSLELELDGLISVLRDNLMHKTGRSMFSSKYYSRLKSGLWKELPQSLFLRP